MLKADIQYLAEGGDDTVYFASSAGGTTKSVCNEQDDRATPSAPGKASSHGEFEGDARDP